MKFNKYTGFSLAELMVMLAVLTILLAAFAPIFTARYKNAGLENVWTYVADDDQYDASADQINKTLPAQLFIGIQPGGKSEVQSAISDGISSLYSKVILRASDNLEGVDGEKQKQIRFQYGNNKEGDIVGTMFAGNENILTGGQYVKINTAKGNTSFGYNTMNEITSGERNSVLGESAGLKITTAKDNTLIGYKAGAAISSADGNTYIGTENSYNNNLGKYNVSIGNYSGPSNGSYNTVVGDYSATSSANDYNTIVGYAAVKDSIGSGNTAVGTRALSGALTGSYNTAIGYNACSGLHGNAWYKTCIGYNSGSSVRGSSNDFLLSDSLERIYIGAQPAYSTLGTAFYGASVLEVHNIDSKTSNTGVSGMGTSSVVINGNLIVRGQPYLTVPSYFYNGAALVGFKKERPKDATQLHTLMGYDGHRKDKRIRGRKNRLHAKYGAHTNCTCARPCGSGSSSPAGYKSYDWSTIFTDEDKQTDDFNWKGKYTDLSTGEYCHPRSEDDENEEIDLNYAHGYTKGSCCPNLRSDIRLKDITDSFSAGLNEIKKINIYNYTFKSDTDKLPHVGVIAQDLKRVFPTAVSKDKNGYYQIRWDEMLYAAINAVKTLDSKIEELASRVVKDRARIAALKKDNADLNKKLDVLENELSKLEQK